MTVADAYLVFFAAINTADLIFAIWLVGTIVVNIGVYYFAEKLTQSVSTWTLVLYGLFAVPLLGRWGIALNKIMELADLLRDQGESMPLPELSAVFGLSMVLFVVLLTTITLAHIRSRRRKVRVI